MTAPTSIAEPYIRLAHGIDAHSPGFIDGYGGPAEWADRSLRPLPELAAQAGRLSDLVDSEPDAERRGFLTVQVRAMGTMLRLLGGETLAYADEVRGLYDIFPLHTPESTFEAAHAALERALPGNGALGGRLEALRSRVAVPQSDLLKVAAPILNELRSRTARLLPLPDGEDFSIGLVQDKPWGGYNWPLGNFRSRIDINTDLPVSLTSLPDLLAHEGYPGHHTEHALKELHLARDRGWQEHGLQLINAPECVVSEGIAVNALRAVMTRQEVDAWLTGELCGLAGLDDADVEAMLAASRALDGLDGVSGNAALLLHQEGRPEAEVLDYLQTYALATPERARQSLKFISNPNFRAYIFTYSVGGALVRRAMEAGDAREVFQRLLTRPVTPGELAG
ncbi:hypothetical protein [Deinococcus sp.]|uniref:hypothetical protein n=1 Tax=Deinococcus sp. TaxID=47478 RepID=UPI003C7C57F6